MTRSRFVMLSLGLAILAGAGVAAPAVAQCFWCTSGPGPADGSAVECNYCVHNALWGLDDYCTTPECERCEVGGQFCLGSVVMLDGRLRPDGTDGSVPLGYSHASSVGTVPAVYGSDLDARYAEMIRNDLVPASIMRRRCDGGIIARRYSASEAQAIFASTIRIRI